ncbi:nucleoside triphosphate pyrophosphohydrolase [Spongorhabdus nitratireducens]
MTDRASLEELQQILAMLRDQDKGCAWSREQTFETIAPFTLEEAYEVLAAIRDKQPELLCDELGDLLLQVVFHARMAEEQGLFDLSDVIGSIVSKMRRRNPHIFGAAADEETAGDNLSQLDAEAVMDQWRAIKQQEKQGCATQPDSVLDGVLKTLPALKQAQQIQLKAAGVGFDWPDKEPVFAKIEEEVAELREVSDDDPERNNRDRQEDELGDLLFAVVNLARHHGLDAEQALLRANTKFKRRFLSIEQALAAVNRSPQESTLEEMEALWQSAKAQE